MIPQAAPDGWAYTCATTHPSAGGDNPSPSHSPCRDSPPTPAWQWVEPRLLTLEECLERLDLGYKKSSRELFRCTTRDWYERKKGKGDNQTALRVGPDLRREMFIRGEYTISNGVYLVYCHLAVIDRDCHDGDWTEAWNDVREISSRLDAVGIRHDVAESSRDAEGSPRGYHIEIYFADQQFAPLVTSALRKLCGTFKVEIFPMKKAIRLAFIPNKYGIGRYYRVEEFNQNSQSLLTTYGEERDGFFYNTYPHGIKSKKEGETNTQVFDLGYYVPEEVGTRNRLLGSLVIDCMTRGFNDATILSYAREMHKLAGDNTKTSLEDHLEETWGCVL